MSFRDPPRSAAWRHLDAREGFEVVFIHADDDRYRLEGGTAAVEGSSAWVVEYAITVGADWSTRSAVVSGRSVFGRTERKLETDGGGRWRIDGARRTDLDGCLEVDLESSALTNAVPVHRLGLAIGEAAEAPAAYARATDLAVERLDQRYERLENDGDDERYRSQRRRLASNAS